MESILSSIPGVVVYIDDVLVTGKSEQEHLSALDEVLCRIMESGLRLRKNKCVFLAPSVVILDIRLTQRFAPCCRKSRSSAGSTCSKERLRVEVISWAADLLFEISAKFVIGTHTTLQAAKAQQAMALDFKAFERSKELLLSSQLLVHFDPNLEIHLACEASSYGIGAVLSQNARWV